MEKKTPRITTCIFAYQHEKFIKKCLEGAVNQVLDDEHLIIIGEDKSSDKTLEICREYQQKYPELIKVIERNPNVGMMANWLETLKLCQSEYIAICEGDDYWIDNSKLQKQITFLDENPEYVFCSTRTKRINEKGEFGENVGKKYGRIILDDVLWKNEIGTCTIVFRSKFLNIPPFENYKSFFGLDWQMWCSLLKNGPGYNLKDLTAIYHEHNGGASSGRDRKKILKNKLEDRMLMIDNFPEKKAIIKKYGLKIIHHYLWKSATFHKNYLRAAYSNRKIIKDFINY